MDALLAAARAGRGRVVVLTGEAGAGKTTLSRAFAERASPQTKILWGACEDLSTPAPLGPFFDLARDCDWDLAHAISGASSPLAVFSEAIDKFDSPDDAALAVVEDAHWADAASLDFLRYLGRRIRQTHIVLLITARTYEAQAHRALGRMLAEIPADDVERIEAPPLSAAAVATLARDAGREGDELFETTAGNAFFVTEALRSGAASIPTTARDAVLARFDKLSARARQLLELVSVFPRRAETGLIEAVDPHDHEQAVEECVNWGMLETRGDFIAFRHEIARRAIEETLARAKRRALNKRALDAMERRGGDSASRLAHHASEANEAEATQRYAPRAAMDAAQVGAHREAARHFAAALMHAEAYPLADRITLYEKSAFEHHLIGLLDSAIQHQHAALVLHREKGDQLKAGDSLRWLSRMSWLHGDRGAAERFAAEAVAALGPLTPGRELAMAYSNKAQLAMLGSDSHAAADWGGKAIALAENLGEQAILSHALNNVGAAMQWRDPTQARAHLARSLDIALAIDAQEHVARSYTNASCAEVELRSFESAHRLVEAGILYCQERDLDTWRDYMRGWLAELLLREGRWNDAAATASLVVSGAAVTPVLRSPATLALARLRMRRGDPEVEPLLADTATLFEKGAEPPRFIQYAAIRAEQAWLKGVSEDDTAALILRALEMASRTESDWLYGEAAFWSQTVAADRAKITIERAAEPYRFMLAGKWEAAAQSWKAIGAPYDRALALLGGDEKAVREAHDEFVRLGATPAASLARVRMLEKGLRGPRSSTLENPAGLTKRQMDVLAQIEAGLSNAEIGKKLFVSAKTVDHHVSAILAKLGAASRAEAAAIARRSGILK